MHPIKGIENLLGACEILRAADVVAWSLTVAGTGEPGYVQGLVARLAEGGLSDRVTFVGHVTEESKQRLFAGSDLLILPSHTENFGQVAYTIDARPDCPIHLTKYMVYHTS